MLSNGVHYSHMVNLFPVLYLAILGNAILRIFLGLIFVYLGFSHLGKNRATLTDTLTTQFPLFGRYARFMAMKLALVELIIGGMIVVGAYTQIAVLAGMVISLKMLIFRKKLAYPLVPPPTFWILVFAACASLFFTGAGAFAFDFPI